MSSGSFEANEVIKILIGFIGTIAGSYLLFVLKAIGKDIRQLKELLMTHVDEIKGDIVHLREDIGELYNLHRDNERRITECSSSLALLRIEHDREIEICHRNRK